MSESERNELAGDIRNWKRIKPFTDVLGGIGSLLCGLATCGGALVGWWAFSAYQGSNRVAARAQLYNTNEMMADREIHDRMLSTIYSDLSDIESPKDYISAALRSVTTDEKILHAQDAKALYELIWSGSYWLEANTIPNQKQIHNARKAYLHTESYLYQTQNAADYHKEKILSDGEWQTWIGDIDAIGAHPIMLAALYSAACRHYISNDFATQIREKLVSDKKCHAVLELYYKEMLDRKWLENFPVY